MLKHTIESLDGVDESLKGFYSESEGRYQLQVDLAGSGFEKVDGLKSALAKVKDERNQLKTEIEPLSRFKKLLDVEGFDPDNVDELMAKAANATDPEAIEKINRQSEKKIGQLQEELTKYQSLAESAVKQKDNYIIETELFKAVSGAGLVEGSEQSTVKLTRGEFRLVDGKVIHVDADGDPTGLTPSEFYKTANRESNPWLYKAENISGSGSKSGSSGSAGSKVKSFAEAQTKEEKVEAIRAKLQK